MKNRNANIPKERITSVKPGCNGYVGLATSVMIGGEDVIVIARTVEQLRKVTMGTAITSVAVFKESLCYPVVLIHRQNADVDDEL